MAKCENLKDGWLCTALQGVHPSMAVEATAKIGATVETVQACGSPNSPAAKNCTGNPKREMGIPQALVQVLFP